MKIDWLGHKARTNLSIFYDHLSNLQVAQFLGLRFVVLNAPSAKVYGAEIEQTFKLSPELTLTGATTYLQGRFRHVCCARRATVRSPLRNGARIYRAGCAQR